MVTLDEIVTSFTSHLVSFMAKNGGECPHHKDGVFQFGVDVKYIEYEERTLKEIEGEVLIPAAAALAKRLGPRVMTERLPPLSEVHWISAFAERSGVNVRAAKPFNPLLGTGDVLRFDVKIAA